jgi:hypothetical protein
MGEITHWLNKQNIRIFYHTGRKQLQQGIDWSVRWMDLR